MRKIVEVIAEQHRLNSSWDEDNLSLDDIPLLFTVNIFLSKVFGIYEKIIVDKSMVF